VERKYIPVARVLEGVEPLGCSNASCRMRNHTARM
jgi:hypothetical protein